MPSENESCRAQSLDAMSGLVFSLWLTMQIQGAGSCPAAGEVEGKLAPLLPPDFMESSADRAVIAEGADGALSVSLARPDGRTVGQRRLPRAATCAEQAETVAVTLAVWEAQIHPEISLRLDGLTAAPSSAVVAVPPSNRELALRAPIEPRHTKVTTWAVGAGLVGSWQPGSVAPGGRLDAMLGAVDRPWRWQLSLAGLGKHTLSLGPGQANWWRVYLALGADYALPLGRRWALALGAAGVAGLATADGSGFSTDRTARAVDLGVEGMLRVEVRLGAVRPWLGLTLVTWLRQQTLEVTGTATSVVLPRAEPMIAVGADFCGPP
jgi:hypothetical protein